MASFFCVFGFPGNCNGLGKKEKTTTMYITDIQYIIVYIDRVTPKKVPKSKQPGCFVDSPMNSFWHLFWDAIRCPRKNVDLRLMMDLPFGFGQKYEQKSTESISLCSHMFSVQRYYPLVN